MEMICAADGNCQTQLDLLEKHQHGGGVVHGGVAFTLADWTMASGLMSTLEEGQACATVELKISYLNPVVEGRLSCRSEMIRRGKRVAFLKSAVTHNDTLVATARATFAIFDIPRPDTT